jgi:hypothetical protein
MAQPGRTSVRPKKLAARVPFRTLRFDHIGLVFHNRLLSAFDGRRIAADSCPGTWQAGACFRQQQKRLGPVLQGGLELDDELARRSRALRAID